MRILERLRPLARARGAVTEVKRLVRVPWRLTCAEEKLDAMREQVCGVERLAQDTDVTLRRVVEYQRALLMRERIDVVDNGGFTLFMFKDDLAYTGLAEGRRNRAAALVGGPPEGGPRGPATDVDDYIGRWTPSSRATDRLLAHFVKTWGKFTVIDVGCQYGTSAMAFAQFVDSIGGECEVFAFDCGMAGELAGYNVRVNRYEDRVHFYPYAVSSHDGYCRMAWKVGHTEDNHIARRLPGDPVFAKPVKCVALDSFAAEVGIAGPVFVKIDTQGVEDAVLGGMRGLLREQMVGGVVEFVPHIYRNRGVDLGFIRDLTQTHVVLDAGVFLKAAGTAGLREVLCNEVEEYAISVDESPARWTDLMFIPRGMPGLDELLRAFRTGAADANGGQAAAA